MSLSFLFFMSVDMKGGMGRVAACFHSPTHTNTHTHTLSSVLTLILDFGPDATPKLKALPQYSTWMNKATAVG